MVAAYKSASASLIAPMQYSQILWATAFGALFFDEIPDNLVFLGAAIVIGSGLYIVWRESSDKVSEVKPVLSNVNPRRDAGPSTKPKGAKSMGISLRF